ncbi:MAG: 16S rRNA (adenine(1518)-N(6)/adenine(1519)-N(6))-dimethyltransferase RsmA [Clostridia bacterium]|nr:16S rRNA (adenine(1518)-N(6)/adenine(1519)-N(6))-dimethyltransferase RsmA [Clostridia bacterium]
MQNQGISPGLRARIALEKHGFSFTHSLGQNFILDDDFLEEIALESGVGEGEAVLEIGPGPGLLTHHLASHCRQVLALEIDRKLEPVLNEVLEGVNNAEIIFEDVMKCDLSVLLEERFPGENVQVVANLPYYITADVIERLLTCGANIGNITVMVQKEAAERIGAQLGNKNYCALAMLTQYYYDVEELMDVSPDRFSPPPHVMSRLIRLNRRMDGLRAKDEKLLLRLIRSAFRMRRKTLVNNLTGDFGVSREQAEKLLMSQNLDVRIRGEALSVKQITRLSDALGEMLQSRANA